ncbi:hypothetical protein Q4Q39_02235 [Flavivirga amylovorans]|uniref:3-keto-disaccharide hydrolase domain-containing protein n=1 Tax=Flavivirga amylovorans TaxID=870486 RepID=A0ABT8WX02_9FLAO|nr:hypothetical protein [Flavivirga amylovorans]MDO5986211.1 hypothetical protein [Flavivirga amylovorans]
MKLFITSILVLLLTQNINCQQEEVSKLLKEKGVLLFEDQFDRDEPNETEENIGNGWQTNSVRITKDGKKQADLVKGTLLIGKSEDAKHGPYVYHKAGFKNGVIQSRFKIFTNKGIGFNIVDPNYKGSSFGHICEINIGPKSVSITDGKNGRFSRKFIKQKRNGTLTKEEKKIIASMKSVLPFKTSMNDWHQVSILYLEDTIKIYIDNQFVGQFTSDGFAHPIKADFGFAVWGKVQIDNLKIWSID